MGAEALLRWSLWMSATARRRRTEAMVCGTCRSGRIGGAARPEASGWRRCLPLVGGAPPRGEKAALGDQEAVGCDAEAGVVVEAAPAAALVVPEADLLLQFLVIALDHPARLGGVHEVAERARFRAAGWRASMRAAERNSLMKPPARTELDGFTCVIDRILEEDRGRPRKQRHTARRVFQRIKAEHGFAGGETIVKAYVRERRLRGREMFVPLVHPPGHGQADFGEAVAVVGGEERKIHFFCLDLPHSDACFVKAYPAETVEAFCDGHNAAFSFFGGVPRSMLYDNTRLAVARILGDGTRQRTRAFAQLQSHHLFADRFGRPGKGNDKGKVEGLVGYARRNFLVPVPQVDSLATLNARLEVRCRERQGARLRGHEESIGERLARDRAAMLPLPAAPYEACETRGARVSSLSLVRYRGSDYSVPVAYGHREVVVRGHVEEVVISSGATEIARHPRSYGHA